MSAYTVTGSANQLPVSIFKSPNRQQPHRQQQQAVELLSTSSPEQQVNCLKSDSSLQSGWLSTNSLLLAGPLFSPISSTKFEECCFKLSLKVERLLEAGSHQLQLHLQPQVIAPGSRWKEFNREKEKEVEVEVEGGIQQESTSPREVKDLEVLSKHYIPTTPLLLDPPPARQPVQEKRQKVVVMPASTWAATTQQQQQQQQPRERGERARSPLAETLAPVMTTSSLSPTSSSSPFQTHPRLGVVSPNTPTQTHPGLQSQASFSPPPTFSHAHPHSYSHSHPHTHTVNNRPTGPQRLPSSSTPDSGISPTACFLHSHLDSSIHHPQNQVKTEVSPSKKDQSDQGSISGYPSHSQRAHTMMSNGGLSTMNGKRKKPEPLSGGHASVKNDAKVVTLVGVNNDEDDDEDDDDSDTASEGRSGGQNSAVQSDQDDDNDDDEEQSSLTRKLAETAVSVREMSKQLGQARVVSHVQSVMIITKARDNQLIRLTRELALWLMKTNRNGRDRGLVVYVDSQLRKSKRFDAEGMARSSPELFRPLPRRYSRTSSSASLSGSAIFDNSGTTSPTGHPNPNHHNKHRITPLSQLTEAVLKRSMSNSDHGRNKSGEVEEGQLRYWTNEMCTKSPHLFDFVITLGGDGTVLYASWLFQRIVPPVIPFALGSLGFLTNFDFSSYATTLNNAIDRGIRVNLRMRFTCTVYRAIEGEACMKRRAVRSGKTGGIFMNSLTRDGWEAIESGGASHARETGRAGQEGKDKEIKCFSTRPVETFEVLNDLVVDRGPSPYVSLLELFGDEHHMTTVQADGLTVSTPTGSTAYSLSAGGSLVHPEVPALLVTPICPHTLSFRPMLLPDSMELRIVVPYNSRSTAWASFDGRGRVELRQGDHIKVTASQYPFPTVCADKQSTDWFHSIARTLKWNERQRQKSFVILEQSREELAEGDEDGQNSVNKSTTTSPKAAAAKGNVQFLKETQKAREEIASSATDAPRPNNDLDDDGGEVDDGEEHYDIDDLSQADDSSPSITPKDPITEEIPEMSKHRVQSPSDSLTDTSPSFPPRERENSDFSSSSELKEDEMGRFRDPAPHPPKLSTRHSHNDPARKKDVIMPVVSSSAHVSRAPSLSDTNRPPSQQNYRLSASTARRRERGEEGDRDHIREPLSVKRTVGGSRRPGRSKDRGQSNDGTNSKSGSGGQRAFAVVGADSDTSASDAD